MIYKFSPQLRDRAKAYFGKLYQREVSDGEADEYLQSLVGLYDFFLQSLE